VEPSHWYSVCGTLSISNPLPRVLLGCWSALTSLSDRARAPPPPPSPSWQGQSHCVLHRVGEMFVVGTRLYYCDQMDAIRLTCIVRITRSNGVCATDGRKSVLTCVDNLEARLYVDGECVKRGLPMVDSGTLGAKGRRFFLPGVKLCLSSDRMFSCDFCAPSILSRI
jgi:hypothetical protein